MKDSVRESSGNEIAVVGYAARLPGANTVDEVWQTLVECKCHVAPIPESRWSSTRFFDPRRDVPGRTYARSAGLLKNVYDFDAGYFGLSPREAEQMDPQQRVLLETVAHAFDNAGLDPSRLDHERTGVFVGASSSDHSTIGLKDPRMIDAQYMLGNTLSIISNRISYQWDIKGPSYTVDTACSSGLFALDQAFRAITSGEIDTAVVGSVNMLLSPLPFVGFSRASMLSEIGLCQAFGKNADGYVRGEGAVVFILRRADLARVSHDRIRSLLLATGTNSDGRTTGIAMPSSIQQRALLEQIKSKFDIDPEDLAFIEAHGTGTPVGDPEEAQAIGAAYGQSRSMPLPMGSAKTNFGHLEPAAGLVGLLKAQLSLEKGMLPASLHADDLNPKIPFDDLGLSVAREPITLPTRSEPWLAAVNSFGFGGANAHAILAQVEDKPKRSAAMPDVLLLTAATETSLKALAKEWADREDDEESLATAICDANNRLARRQKRLAVTASSADILRASLSSWLSDEETPAAAAGTARVDAAKVGFVFSGNGSQWAGMGRSMLLRDQAFRESFQASNDVAIMLGGASLLDQIMSPDLEERLERAPVAQPLLLAVQIATVDALAARAVSPDAVLGHSAGEVAAAYTCGAISREDAFRIILARSATLDRLYGKGTMAALSADCTRVAEIIESAGLDVDIAAENSATSITVSGPKSDVTQLLKLCRKKRIAGRQLPIEYPYHSRQTEHLQRELIDELEDISGRKSRVPFISGCKGSIVSGDELDNRFWWHNARDAVQFRSGIEAMAEAGVTLFLEISPKSVLQSYIRDTLEETSLNGIALGSLEQTGADQIDSFSIALKLLAHGLDVDDIDLLGEQGRFRGDLPVYPFDRKTHALHTEREIDLWGTHDHHALLGSRLDPDGAVWTSELSLGRLPWLGDHKVDGRVLLPATAVLEMFLAAARDISGSELLELRHFEILRPVQLREGQTVPTRVTYEKAARRLSLEVLQGGSWAWVAGAAVFELGTDGTRTLSLAKGTTDPDVYSQLLATGLEYGPAFARLQAFEVADTSIDVSLRNPDRKMPGFVLDPTATDAALHGIMPLLSSLGDTQDEGLFVPGHIGRIRLYRVSEPSGARISLVKGDATGICVDVSFTDDRGDIVAEFSSLWLRPMPTIRKTLIRHWNEEEIPLSAVATCPWAPTLDFELGDDVEPSDLEIVRDSIGARLAWNVVNCPSSRRDLDRRTDEAEHLLRAVDALSDNGADVEEKDPCPWPDVAELIGLLTEIEPTAVDEIEATLHGATSDRVNNKPGFSRVSAAVQDYLSNRPIRNARILIVGHVDGAILNHLTGKAGHIVIAVENDDAADAMRLKLERPERVHIALIDEAFSLPNFDLTLGLAVAQKVLPSSQKQLARFAARGNRTLLFDYVPDAFELMTGRYSDADALHYLDAQFANVGMPVERKSWALNSSIAYAYVDPESTQRPATEKVSVLGTSDFADRLREAGPSDESAASVAIIPLEAGVDLMSSVLQQPDAFRSIPQNMDRVWIVQEGLGGGAALRGWRRSLRNELGRDIRSMSIEPGVDLQDVIEITAHSSEHEVVLTKEGAFSSRIVHQATNSQNLGEDGRLILKQGLNRDTASLSWINVPRMAPKDTEIEIEVAATALNFRDVMFARGLLPPDILNGGFAGPTLGMECSGVVSRAGASSGFKPGDRVIAFAPSAFATHVTVEARAAISVPSSLDLKAAAAMPVVFVTAEYALTELAHLKAGEWCLIHGGAGGVGLAAIQVAKRAGARIIATAGSDRKRALLKFLGVDHVCDSRSLEFVQDVAEITGGKGVDVILNSLAGEAMEQGLSCLAPFGRFIELGKRDFVSNTAIGLRPMRNNISYFGVDADQLLLHRPNVANKIMKNIAEGFEAGDYSLPPVRTFSSKSTLEAFRLMETAGHIGKIVIEPPGIEAAKTRPSQDYTGAWLVSGGTKGFGLATARFLASKGADSLWLLSRSGMLDDPEFISEMSQRGIEVHVRACDLTDASAVRTLFGEVEEIDGNLAGVVCGAAVFDDAMLSDIDATRIEKVVRAKLSSALILDAESRRFDLRHFWLYSSVSCRFGNPGQSAYVAANMELEALAKRRSEEGLPALAIAWGPIADAGYLTGAEELRGVIERTLGSVMPAEAALEDLFKTLDEGFDLPVITIAPVDWARLKSELPLLSEPLFEYLAIKASDIGQDGIIDVRGLLAEKGEAKTRKVLLDILCQEAAQIMRIAPGEIDVARDLTDLGFDSLMGMSLKLAMEERLGMATPITSVGDGMTLSRLAHLIVTSAASDTQSDETDVMAARHLSDTDMPEDLKREIANVASR